MVVRRVERLGPRVSDFNIFAIELFTGLAFPDPKRLIIPGLSGFMPKVFSISSNVGDYIMVVNINWK